MCIVILVICLKLHVNNIKKVHFMADFSCALFLYTISLFINLTYPNFVWMMSMSMINIEVSMIVIEVLIVLIFSTSRTKLFISYLLLNLLTEGYITKGEQSDVQLLFNPWLPNPWLNFQWIFIAIKIKNKYQHIPVLE